MAMTIMTSAIIYVGVHQLARRFTVTLPLAKWDMLSLTLLLVLSLTRFTQTYNVQKKTKGSENKEIYDLNYRVLL